MFACLSNLNWSSSVVEQGTARSQKPLLPNRSERPIFHARGPKGAGVNQSVRQSGRCNLWIEIIFLYGDKSNNTFCIETNSEKKTIELQQIRTELQQEEEN